MWKAPIYRLAVRLAFVTTYNFRVYIALCHEAVCALRCLKLAAAHVQTETANTDYSEYIPIVTV